MSDDLNAESPQECLCCGDITDNERGECDYCYWNCQDGFHDYYKKTEAADG